MKNNISSKHTIDASKEMQIQYGIDVVHELEKILNEELRMSIENEIKKSKNNIRKRKLDSL